MNKRILATTFLLLSVLCGPSHALTAPSLSGTVTLDYGADGITTLDWAVYAPTDTGSVAGVSATDFTYQYTLHSWAGYPGSLFWDIGKDPAFAVTGLGLVGGGADPATGIGDAGGSFALDNVGAFTSLTAWYTSTLGPAATWMQTRVSGIPPGPSTPINIGAGFDSQLIMGAGTSPGPGLGGAPGVPEPETWALILLLMAFTTWWMRRRQDEHDPLETSIRV